MNGFSENANNLTEVGGSLYGRGKPPFFGVALNAAIVVLCVLLFAEAVFNLFFMGIYVVNVSMQPTLNGAQREDVSGGDFIYVNKFAEPDYGDIVVVYREVTEAGGRTAGGNIIKRAVAFGGDTVKMVDGVLYLNGAAVEESYVDLSRIDKTKNNFPEHTVKANCMFLLGDNRNNSTDSREFGDYPMESLVGVMPDWSYNSRGFSTAVYTFFNFTLFGK